MLLKSRSIVLLCLIMLFSGASEAAVDLEALQSRILTVSEIKPGPVRPAPGSESCGESYVSVKKVESDSSITISLGAKAMIMGLKEEAEVRTESKDRSCQSIVLLSRYSNRFMSQNLTQNCGGDTFRYTTQVEINDRGFRVTRSSGFANRPSTQVCEYLYQRGKG